MSNGTGGTPEVRAAETKEHFGGYYRREAADLNAPGRMAARIPGAQYGRVGVRPVAQDAETLRVVGDVAAQA